MNEQLTELQKLFDEYDLTVRENEKYHSAATMGMVKDAFQKIVKWFDNILTKRVALAKQEKIKKLRLKKGDYLVVRNWDSTAIEQLARLKDVVDFDVPIINLEGDMEIDTYTWEQLEKLHNLGGGKAV